MNAVTRFVARCLTGAGFVALGADALFYVESATRPPYTLAWIGEQSTVGDATPVLAAVTATGTPLGALPVSLVLLWLGAMLFVAAARHQ